MGKYLVELNGKNVEISAKDLEDAEDTAFLMANLAPKGVEVWYKVTEVDPYA